MNTVKVSLMLLLVSVCTNVHAASVADEQAKLASLQNLQARNVKALAEVEQAPSGSSSTKLEQARAELALEQKELEQVKAKVAAAEKAYSAAPSQDNRRVVTKINHSLKMAERGVRSRTKRLQRIEGKLSGSQQELAELKTAIASGEKKIAEQKERVAMVAAALDRQAAAQALNAQKKAAEQATERAAKALRQQELQRNADTARQQAEAAVVQAAAKPVLSAADQQAMSQVRGLNTRLSAAAAKGGKAPFSRVIFRGDKIDNITLEHVGAKFYRAEVKVSQGKQKFTVNRSKFMRTIPAADDGEVYVFILDYKKLDRPELSQFKKSLLEHL